MSLVKILSDCINGNVVTVKLYSDGTFFMEALYNNCMCSISGSDYSDTMLQAEYQLVQPGKFGVITLVDGSENVAVVFN